MCGVAGIVSNHSLNQGALVAMSDALEHRGPDGRGFLVSDLRSPLRMTADLEPATRSSAIVGLAHRRLSIIDLTTANDQPLVDRDGRYAIAHNGEIYNYRELRADLERHGHAFRTTGDTEVALYAYKEWGTDCFERFVGMWALAILDLHERRLVLSRDRFGIKPLYWTVSRGCLLFASEIKALVASALVEPKPNEQTVARYLTTARVDVDNATFFDGIHQMPTGTTATVALDNPAKQLRFVSYWSLPEPDAAAAFESPAKMVREALEDSLRLHVRSDVAVGTCLSGGIDSSGIVGVTNRLRGSGIDATFTHAAFGYVPPEQDLSEQRYMEAVAEMHDANLIYANPTQEELISTLPTVIASQDEPFVSSSIAAQWFVFRAAREAGIKVMLDGQGADEVFGGYHGYLTLMAEDYVLQGKPLAYLRFTRACRASVGRSPHPSAYVLGALLPEVLRGLSARAFLQLRSKRASTRALSAPQVSAEIRALAPRANGRKPLDVDDLLRADVSSQNLPGLLRYEDRNSMAHSIEARVPYLDHRLVELAFRMPAAERMRDATPKQVLREALKDVLPDIVLARRDKIGFRASPSATWQFARRHRDSLVQPRNDAEERWFIPSEVGRLIDSPAANAETEFSLWRTINAKLWARRFWGGEDSPRLRA